MGWDALHELTLTREQMEQRRLAAGKDLLNGISQAEVARKYGVSEVTAHRWNQALEESGLDALKRTISTGAPNRMSDQDKKRLSKCIDKGAKTYGYRTDHWTTKRVAHVIKKEFGVDYTPRHCSRILRQLGYGPRKPKREAAEKDHAAKEKWLRTTWRRIKKN